MEKGRGSQESSHHLASVRAATYRLSSSPIEQLPHTAAHIARSLWSCRHVLSVASDQSKSNNDAHLTVHRFKTTLSSLLQDRVLEKRWAAVVLIKSTIEAGGLEVLSKSNGWIKGLLGVLKKADPPTIKTLTIVALTRIFMLTWDHTNLVRELTTPNLPVFISNCLNIISRSACSSIELETVLLSFEALISHHPTIFRSHETRLRPLLEQIVSSSDFGPSSDAYYNSAQCALAGRLLVALHHCAPKQGGAKQWERSLKAAVDASHSTCDLIFRSVIEHWKPPTQATKDPGMMSNVGELERSDNDAAGLGPWKGMYEGCQRLTRLLNLVQSHIDQATAGSVSAHAGLVVGLLVRLSSVTSNPARGVGSVQANVHFANDEREALLSILPDIHEVTFGLQEKLIGIFGRAIVSSSPQLLEMTVAVFNDEFSHVALRTRIYRLVAVTLRLHGSAMLKEEVSEISPVLDSCFSDALATASGRDITTGSGRDSVSKENGSLHLAGSKATTSYVEFPKLGEAARALLVAMILCIRAECVSPKLRSTAERTAVLTQHKDALLACVQNPQVRKDKAQPSLVPLLARLNPGDAEVETLLRPRLPLVAFGECTTGEDQLLSEVDDEAEEIAADEANDLQDLPTAGTVKEVNAAGSSAQMSSHSDEKTQTQENSVEDLSRNMASKRRFYASLNDDAMTKRSRNLVETDSNNFQSTSTENWSHIEPLSTNIAHPIQVTAGEVVNNQDNLKDTANLMKSSIDTVRVSGQGDFPADMQTAGQAEVQTQGRAADDDEDDSDFEIPPLTMEQDTDLEDED